MSPRTKNNLNSALESAALTFAKYSLFAARARMDEDWELAREFQQTADVERIDHFAREADLEGLIEDSPENLRNAIKEEIKQIQISDLFAREAIEDQDFSVATEFEKISREKMRRCARFRHLLDVLSVQRDIQMNDLGHVNMARPTHV